jgi:hypothetical protein
VEREKMITGDKDSRERRAKRSEGMFGLVEGRMG